VIRHFVCFDAVDWVTGMPSAQQISWCTKSHKSIFENSYRRVIVEN